MSRSRDLANLANNATGLETLTVSDITDLTATASELNKLDGVTADTTELNLLDGVTATTAELNYVDGVSSAIQTQINAKAPLASPTFTGTTDVSSGATFPAGTVIKKTYYSIGRGTYTSNRSFPNDDTIPQKSEGEEIFSQAYTPSTSNCNLFITTYCRLGESANNANDMTLGLFISDSDDCLILGEAYTMGDGNVIHSANVTLMYSMASWGTTAKTFSLRAGGGDRFNYSNRDGSMANAKYSTALKSAFIIEEVAT